MKKTILLLTVLLLGTQSFASDISASYSNSSFEEIFYVDRVTEIEMWQQPRLQYTPKNLRTQYQMRFNGRTQTGVASYTLPITDYDTYITESYFQDGKFYIKDNTGKSFQTGELQEIDTSALETAIQNNTTNISNLTTKVDNNTTAIQNNTENINKLDTRVTNNTTAIQTNADNITNLQNNLNTTNVQVNKNTQDIHNLDSRVTTNTNNIEINRQNIESVSNRVTQNTNQINTNTQNIQANTERLNKHETQITKNTNDIKTNAKNIEVNRRNIQTNAKNIQKVSTQVQSNTQNINALKNGMARVNTRMDSMQSQIDRLDNRLEQGLATVTALTALHPNPRHQGKTQISIGAGMYADNVAGAVGVFHYLNDRVMLSAGASYGGDSSFAGNVGITIGF